MINKPSDRILSFQIKRAIQAEDTLHAAQKEIARLKSKPKLTDAEILKLLRLERAASALLEALTNLLNRIELARAIEAHILGETT